MSSLIKAKLQQVLQALAPLLAVAIILQVFIVHAPLETFLQFILGGVLAGMGMVLLFIGIDWGVLPMGRFIGAELPVRGSMILIIAVSFIVGFATTAAEPDVLVFAGQLATAAPNRTAQPTIIGVIAIGVGLFTSFAMLRILTGWSMKYMLAAVYLTAIALSLFAPADVIPVAFDAGSVTTGVLSAPVIIALAIGLSSVLAGRSALSDGFGLLGFASVGPIIAILILGLWLQ